jgi:hypothetical protein
VYKLVQNTLLRIDWKLPFFTEKYVAPQSLHRLKFALALNFHYHDVVAVKAAHGFGMPVLFEERELLLEIDGLMVLCVHVVLIRKFTELRCNPHGKAD